jgi:Rrf2 family protein
MKLLTKETDYAIRAAMNLARRGDGFASSRSISTQEKIPLHFLRRILQTLIKGGLVESKEGVAGGFRLRAAADDISIARLIRLFQGNIELSQCMFRRRICSNRKTCVLKKRIAAIESMVEREFEDMTVGDLLRDLGTKNEA